MIIATSAIAALALGVKMVTTLKSEVITVPVSV